MRAQQFNSNSYLFQNKTSRNSRFCEFVKNCSKAFYFITIAVERKLQSRLKMCQNNGKQCSWEIHSVVSLIDG